MTHPTTELIAYLIGDLTPAEREQVEKHLGGCEGCRRERDAFQAVLGDLRAEAPPPPDLPWERWRSELRARLKGRARRRPWWRQPVPLALSTAAAAALVVTVWLGPWRELPRADLASIEEAVLGGRLELLSQYSLVERLDLLEDLEVIRQLDELAPRGEG